MGRPQPLQLSQMHFSAQGNAGTDFCSSADQIGSFLQKLRQGNKWPGGGEGGKGAGGGGEKGGGGAGGGGGGSGGGGEGGGGEGGSSIGSGGYP